MMTQTQPKITVSREGVVTRDGKIIGHVKKEMRQGIFQTILGASASASGTPYWVPFAADGTQLNEYGYDTRKKAVDMLVKHVEPMTVSGLKIDTYYGRRFIDATFKFKGHTFGVSHYADESAWVVDFYMSAESFFPAWSNGAGTRVTGAKVLKGDAHEFVTNAAIAAGLWPMTDSEDSAK